MPVAHDGDDDAVRIANDFNYGLAGNVIGGDVERAVTVANRVRGGMISVNGGAAHGVDVPFGGYKQSGLGRQNGLIGFDQYLETKAIAWPA